ncbi:MAG: nucleoside phosphorylase [Flavobacteriaceae bacterium]|nr:nucleoside phosphorylase [Flavobacteriaceae bacterium]
MNKIIAASELPLNNDGSIYHLNLLPEDIAESIFLVGDPERVPRVSNFFDTIEIQKSKREFVTHTGTKNGKRFTVISTGIGTDNIDIVLTELDALVNIDLETRQIKENKTKLRLIRLGTSGSVNPEIDAGSFVKSRYSTGFDGLMQFYPAHKDADFRDDFIKNFPYSNLLPLLYFSECNPDLFSHFDQGFVAGNTGSLSGFYGPQGREVRLHAMDPVFLDRLHQCGLDNFEMETSAIYALASLLGHDALSLNCIIANRTTGKFLDDYKSHVDQMIETALEMATTQ